MEFDRLRRTLKVSCLLGGAALMSACSVEVADSLLDEGMPEDGVELEGGVVLGQSWQSLSYPTCVYAWSDPDGDGWGWEFNRSCVVNKPSSPSSGGYPTCVYAWSDPDRDGWGWENNRVCAAGGSSTSGGSTSGGSTSGGSTSGGSTSGSCANHEGAASTMAALAVSAAMELGRWQPSKDFQIVRVGWDEMLALTSTGKSRCSGGQCTNTQALLDLQRNEADGQVVFPGNVKLNSPALRSRLVAKFRDQLACEMQPSNGGTTNCPVEEHTLTFQRSEKGGCDTNYFFVAKKPDGRPLSYPAQLKNKLLWTDRTNPYIGFQSVGEVVSIDPTYGLNEEGSASSGSCTAACTKISKSNLAGQCCSCNGQTKKLAKSAWNASTFLCR